MTEEKLSSSRVSIYVMGRKYDVPNSLTMMAAMEHIGYRFIRGVGCRNGYCGACATVYRIKGDYKLRTALACQEVVKDGMIFGQIPFVPVEKVIYNIDSLRPTRAVLLEHYPAIARCVNCNTCTKVCPQDLDVMDCVQAALIGDIEKVANLSFECLECGLCAMRCPAEIVPHLVARLARRLYAKYMTLLDKHVKERIKEIEEGKFDRELERFMRMNVEEIEELYRKRRFM